MKKQNHRLNCSFSCKLSGTEKEHRNQFQKASFFMSNKLLSPSIVISDKINVIVSRALFIAFHLINQSGSTHTLSAGVLIVVGTHDTEGET